MQESRLVQRFSIKTYLPQAVPIYVLDSTILALLDVRKLYITELHN
jgi:hypothetical protein